MQLRPVAVARPSRYKFLAFLVKALFCLPILLAGLITTFPSYAQQEAVATPYLTPSTGTSNYLGRIGYNDSDQLAEALMRVDGLYDFDEGSRLANPVAIVVHGPEVAIFQRQNYQQNKLIVDLAAKLTALGILDISVCEARLSTFGADKESVYPFVGTVPFGPTEVNRLLDKENYVYF